MNDQQFENIPVPNAKRTRAARPPLDRVTQIIAVVRSMVDEAWDEAYEFAVGKKLVFVTEGLMYTHIADEVSRTDETNQKRILKGVKEIKRGDHPCLSKEVVPAGRRGNAGCGIPQSRRPDVDEATKSSYADAA